MKRIVVFTVDHLEFSPLVMEKLLQEHQAEIVRIYVSRTHLGVSFIFRKLAFFIRNFYPFCISLGDMFRYLKWKWRIRKDAHGYRNIVEVLSARGFDSRYVQDINDKNFINEMKSLDADIFVFCMFDQIAKKEMFTIPSKGTFNLHMGKLPEHCGMLSSFWVLRHGNDTAGVSFHEVTNIIDCGNLITEARFPVTTNSMYQLMRDTADKGALVVADGVNRVLDGMDIPIDQSSREKNYYTIPSKEDLRAFYARKCRLI
jgi:methionyl-tRNA formyltransferase